jgi:hypothetical protein
MWGLQEFWWWLDEHRLIAGSGLIVVVVVVVAVVFWIRNDESEPKTPTHTETARPFIAGEGYPPQQLSPEDLEAAGLEPSSEADPIRCESPRVHNPVVAIEPTSIGCGQVSGLIRAYANSGKIEQSVSGFDCVSGPVALRVTCADSNTASFVTLLLGPGGAGLDDCSLTPLGESGEVMPVRATGIDCEAASLLAQRLVEKQGPVRAGYSCEDRDQEGLTTTTCVRASQEIAFPDAD